MPEKDPLVTIKVRLSTRKLLRKSKALYTLETGDAVSDDKIIRTFLESQPQVDVATQRVAASAQHTS